MVQRRCRDAKWEPLENGLGLIGRFVDNDGREGMEVALWRPQQKAIVVSGCGAAGDYYQLRYRDRDLRKTRATGTISGVLPDGRAMQGSFTLKSHFPHMVSSMSPNIAAASIRRVLSCGEVVFLRQKAA